MKKLYAIFLTILFTVTSNTYAQSVRTIFENYLKATGDESNMKSILNIKYEGNFKNYKDNNEKIIKFISNEGYFRTEIYKDTILFMCNCYDGLYFWRLPPNSLTPRNISSSQNTNKAWTINDDSGGEAIFNDLLSYKLLGSSITLVEEQLDGKYDVIRLIKKNSKVIDFYLNSTTHLLEKSVNIQDNNEGSYLIYEDYRKIDATLIPHKISHYILGRLFSITTYDRITLNPEIPEYIFKCQKK